MSGQLFCQSGWYREAIFVPFLGWRFFYAFIYAAADRGHYGEKKYAAIIYANTKHERTEVMERSLVLIKPDAMERKLMGEIISIYENRGLHISSIKIVKPSVEVAATHYFEHKDRPFFPGLIEYITRSEVCALIVEGENAIAAVRKINGATNPMEADMGSVRGKYGISKSENTVHSSDSVESAEREIKIWFPELS